MAADCPYCTLAKKTGELYCSRHQTNMAALRSGVFYIHEKKFEECEPHLTRLSLNFNLDSKQTYFIGNKSYNISPVKYLLINEGQSFSTYANGERESRMVTIAFKVGLAEQLHYVLSNDHDTLLSKPANDRSNRLHLFEQTHFIDEYLYEAVPSLLKFSDNANDQAMLQDMLEQLLIHVLSSQLKICTDLESIQKIKPATKLEIYKRLHAGYEFIHDSFDQSITIDMIADHACLSSFHFKRLFKTFYKESPHQLILKLRIKRSQELLKEGMKVKDVCKNVGFEDVSSFIRLFKIHTRSTPNKYRSGL